MLVKQGASVDLFERLPAPFGLLRYGVAPDHQNIKRAGAAFERTAQSPRVRYVGNVAVGRDLTVAELLAEYDQVLFAIGAATDKKLGVPGEELAGSVAATAFVNWYNGHPDSSADSYDLSHERAVIVGMGNVALDVARLLVRRPSELANTDIADYALSALAQSRVREVVLLGRRGPSQAAFDHGELGDIAALPGVEVVVEGEVSLAGVEELPLAARRNVEFMATLPRAPSAAAERVVRLRFLASPHGLLGQGGSLRAIQIERNELEARPDGSVSARGTGQIDTLETGMVVRSIGYQATPMPGLPFDVRASVVPNVAGRVGKPGEIMERCYVVGWIKRGPVGLLGTNKQDAKETVERMLEDASATRAGREQRSPERVLALLRERGVRAVSYADWQRIDAKERAAGAQRGKIREKFHTVESLLTALDGD
jgi:ferredoxin--NADP+ reductase